MGGNSSELIAKGYSETNEDAHKPRDLGEVQPWEPSEKFNSITADVICFAYVTRTKQRETPHVLQQQILTK